MLNSFVTFEMLFIINGLLISLFGSLLLIVYNKANKILTEDKIVVMIMKEIKEGDFSTKDDISELKAEIVVIRTDLKTGLGDILKLLRKERE